MVPPPAISASAGHNGKNWTKRRRAAPGAKAAVAAAGGEGGLRAGEEAVIGRLGRRLGERADRPFRLGRRGGFRRDGRGRGALVRGARGRCGQGRAPVAWGRPWSWAPILRGRAARCRAVRRRATCAPSRWVRYLRWR